jgi:hypothetical protein
VNRSTSFEPPGIEQRALIGADGFDEAGFGEFGDYRSAIALHWFHDRPDPGRWFKPGYRHTGLPMKEHRQS